MWAQLLNAVLGVWLMAAPAVLQYGGAIRTNDRIVGPLAAACAIIAIWPVTRSVRWVNVVLGVWLIVASVVLAPRHVLLHHIGVGVLLAGLACGRGTLPHQFGGGWAVLWSSQGQTPRSPMRTSTSHADADARPPA
jgi:hypothetical protein